MLIDVNNEKLRMDGGIGPRYVALSYVWGDAHSLKTTKWNVGQLQQDGALRMWQHFIPRVIGDTMDFTKRLGVRYLWVDSLCIVQDDENLRQGVYFRTTPVPDHDVYRQG
ncbi:hypothetical protein B0T16DRAFT_146810 [Cercophora newfieldiana]|uniref:Heterokaryon incompatibility domain-containing protein n=1 Tax=Cercophora newfieldiana TaxID=92897 RepID=A0AA39Y4B5_9PEZI|nr:hypothetical protein B0T16DRAFT_146810 [Cercophora newfieldiana]